MYINWQQRELNLKIVYYGPGLSGKTTNLEQIHAKVDPKRRSELVSLKTNGDRTLFFDVLQLELGKICGLTPKLHLYTVPGQSYYEASRKLVLRGADGVVFVADSSRDRLNANRYSWHSMKTQLDQLKMSFSTLPLVVQFNKQDLDDAMEVAILKKALQVNGLPTFEASAIHGRGVFDTLKAITGAVVQQVQQEIA